MKSNGEFKIKNRGVYILVFECVHNLNDLILNLFQF